MVSETVFWICFFIVFYNYAGYPLLVLILVFIKNLFPKKTLSRQLLRPVTLIVAAYNEEDIIEEKISNCVSLQYPHELLTLLFITDGSTDGTPSIIKKYPQIRHLHQEARNGKLAAMNRAMKFVETEVVIFSDANTILNEDSLLNIVAHYADEKVGGVAGEKKIIIQKDDAVAAGEGLYWKYESFIKSLDSQLYTIVGAAGELFSIRTALYTPLPENIIIEDFVQSLLLCTKGYVVRYEPMAFSQETASVSMKDEMERKIRIAAGGFQAMAFLKKLFNVFRYPVLWFQYFSHRVLRWTLCPVALVGLFFFSALLWKQDNHPFYLYFTLLQAVFYGLAVLGWVFVRKNRHPGVLYLPFYFSFMNFCVFAGFWRYLSGNQHAAWKKAGRRVKI